MINQPSYPTHPLRRKLTTEDLPWLLNLLSRIRRKCVDIGLQLGVNDSTIQSIVDENRNHLRGQLREILRHCLNTPQCLTLEDIIHALKSESVEENLLASQIEAKFPSQALVLASPQVISRPHSPFSSTTSQSINPTPVSESPSSRPGIEPVVSSISHSPQTACLPFWTTYQISSQPLATLTNRIYQCYTGQQPPHPHHTLPPYVPQPVPYPGGGWGMPTPYNVMCPAQQQQPYHHTNPYSSVCLPPSADQYTLSTIPSTTALNISRGSQMHLDTSHQPFSQDQPHFPSSSSTVQQAGQAPPNPHHGMTTHGQVYPHQVSHCQSQQPAFSNLRAWSTKDEKRCRDGVTCVPHLGCTLPSLHFVSVV